MIDLTPRCSSRIPICLLLVFVCIMGNSIADQKYSAEVKRGLKAYQNQEYEQSARIFQSIAKERSQDEDLPDRKKAIPYKFLGHSQYNLNNDGKAREAYQTALSLNPAFSTIYLYLAQIAFRNHQYRETITHCRAGLNSGITKKKLFTLYGASLNQVGEFHQALDVFRQALFRAEDDALSIRKKIAQLYLSTNQPEQAITELDSAIRTHPLDTELLLLRARAAISAGSLDVALNDLEQARHLGENKPDLYRTLADLTFKKQQYRRALFLYKKYFSLIEEPAPQDWNRIGRAALNTGQRTTAETYLFRALKQNPEYTRGHIQLAQQYNEKGNQKKAVALLDKLLTIAPETPRAQILLGNIKLEEEKYDQAETHYQQVYQSGHRDPNFQYNYIQTLLQLDRLDRARSVLQDAISNDPSNNDYHTLLTNWVEKQAQGEK